MAKEKESANSPAPLVRGLRQYQKQQNYVKRAAESPEEDEQEVLLELAPPKEAPPEFVNPYQNFVSELSLQDMEYLLEESSPTVKVLLLKNASREERSRILGEMPREQRTALLRALAKSLQKLDGDGCSKAFHWLHRKVQQKHHFFTPSYEVGGIRTLSTILDGLPSEQEESIMDSFRRDDDDLVSWLERDRGSAAQRQVLREICEELSALELATLFAQPQYGRLLRHMLSAEQMLEILNASIELAQLSRDKRQDIAEEIYSNFPVLQKY